MKKAISFLLILFFFVFINGCTEEKQEPNLNISLEEKQFCIKSTDCVPAQCCHPSYLVNKKYAPDCSGTKSICTGVCSGPLDCVPWIPTCENNTCSYKIERKNYIWKVNFIGCYGCTNAGEIIEFARNIESDFLENEYRFHGYTMWVNGTKELPKSEALHELHYSFTEKGYDSLNKLNLDNYGVVYVYSNK